VEYAPTDALAHSCLGQCLLAAKSYSDAAVELRLAVSIDSDSANYWSLLSQILRHLGILNEAKECLQKAIRLDRCVGYMLAYASLLIDLEDYLSAISVLNEISRESLTEVQKALMNGYLQIATKATDVPA
jgi:tetratricopeptide (TPR) repeat protein